MPALDVERALEAVRARMAADTVGAAPVLRVVRGDGARTERRPELETRWWARVPGVPARTLSLTGTTR